MKSNYNLNGLGVGEIIEPNTAERMRELLERHPGHNDAPNSPYNGIRYIFSGDFMPGNASARADWWIEDAYQLVFEPPEGSVSKRLHDYLVRDESEIPPPDGDETKTHIFKAIIATAREKQSKQPLEGR